MPAASAMSSTVVASKPSRANSSSATRSSCAARWSPAVARPRTGGPRAAPPAPPALPRDDPAAPLPIGTECRYGVVTSGHPCAARAPEECHERHPQATETVTDEGVVETEAAAPVELVEQDLLVEDVSIDGMCGVY